MERYINGLIEDIEIRILYQWKRSVPHYYDVGIQHGNPFLQPPKGWNKSEALFHTTDDELFLFENETFTRGDFTQNMFDLFDLTKEQFPLALRLNKSQLDRLVLQLNRLWEAHNFTAILPSTLPSTRAYTLMLLQMKKPIMTVQFGHISIEFCQYDPTDCPFGESHCSCQELFLDIENNEKINLNESNK